MDLLGTLRGESFHLALDESDGQECQGLGRCHAELDNEPTLIHGLSRVNAVVRDDAVGFGGRATGKGTACVEGGEQTVTFDHAIIAGNDVATYTTVLPTLISSNQVLWNRIMAMALIVAVPPTLILIVFREHIVEGMTLGVANQ